MQSDNIIVIDLDDTLLNSMAMYNEAIKELSKWGVNEENFWAAEKEENRRRKIIGGGRYSIDNHLFILGMRLRLPQIQIVQIKHQLLKFIRLNSGKFLFRDGIDFLGSFKERAELDLLTSGSEELQRAKLVGLAVNGINSQAYFSKIRIAQHEKVFYINEFYHSSNHLNVFIDDSPRQINSVAKERPDIVTIWLNRKEKKVNRDGQEDAPDCDYTAQNFYGVDDILSELL